MRIAHGVTRSVLITRRWAIKIPRIGRSGRGALWAIANGVLANLSEREWSHIDGVCPVVWSLFGLVNIYPRCVPVQPLPGFDYRAVAPDLPRIDARAHNLGRLNGRVVWVDYDQSITDCVACRRLNKQP